MSETATIREVVVVVVHWSRSSVWNDDGDTTVFGAAGDPVAEGSY